MPLNKINRVLPERLAVLGEAMVRLYQEGLLDPSDKSKREEAVKLKKVALRGMYQLIQQWPLDLHLFTNTDPVGIRKDTCNEKMLLLASILFYFQCRSPSCNYRLTMPVMWDMIKRKGESSDGYWRFREAVIANCFCGYIGTGKTSVIYNASGFLKLSKRFLSSLVGGIPSGVARFSRPRAQSGWDIGDGGDGEEAKNK